MINYLNQRKNYYEELKRKVYQNQKLKNYQKILIKILLKWKNQLILLKGK